MKTAIDLISNGNLLVIGRLVDASNATLLAHVEDSDPKFQVIYKPIAGSARFGIFQMAILQAESMRHIY